MMRPQYPPPAGNGMKKTIALLVLTFCCATPGFAAKTYSYFRVGSASDVGTTTTAGTVLMGGGTDVDAAFQWMCERSGNGDFLVIRATGTDAYNPPPVPLQLPRLKVAPAAIRYTAMS